MPNPNRGVFDVALPQSGNYHIRMVDLYGKVVYETSITANHHTIHVEALPPGNYTLTINGATKNYYQQITIIN